MVDAAYIQNKNEKTHRKGTLELIDLYATCNPSPPYV